MCVHNTKDRYGIISQLFHWLMAFIIMALLVIGMGMDFIEDTSQKFQIYMLHKSFGMLILALVVGRILWRFTQVQPEHLSTHAGWERILSKLVHVFLYLGFIGMPLTGWLMTSAGQYPNSFFGLFNVPDLIGKDQDMFRLMRRLHDVFGLCLLAAVGLHFAGAMKHAFVDRDSTINRMVPSVMASFAHIILLVIGLAFFGMIGFIMLKDKPHHERPRQSVEEIVETVRDAIPANQPVNIQAGESLRDTNWDTNWDINYETSYIEFTVPVYGTPFSGRFQEFEGSINFDPQNLEASNIDIKILTASAESGSDDRDQQMAQDVWFDAQTYPAAHFVSTRIERDNSSPQAAFIAHGDLTIRDKTHGVMLPFTLSITKDGGIEHAAAKGLLTIDRLQYGVGQGQWTETDVVGKDVQVTIAVDATR